MESVQRRDSCDLLPENLRVHSVSLPDGRAASVQQKQHPVHGPYHPGVRNPQQRKCHPSCTAVGQVQNSLQFRRRDRREH